MWPSLHQPTGLLPLVIIRMVLAAPAFLIAQTRGLKTVLANSKQGPLFFSWVLSGYLALRLLSKVYQADEIAEERDLLKRQHLALKSRLQDQAFLETLLQHTSVAPPPAAPASSVGAASAAPAVSPLDKLQQLLREETEDVDRTVKRARAEEIATKGRGVAFAVASAAESMRTSVNSGKKAGGAQEDGEKPGSSDTAAPSPASIAAAARAAPAAGASRQAGSATADVAAAVAPGATASAGSSGSTLPRAGLV